MYRNEDEQEVSADDFFTGDGSPGAVHRLLAGYSSTCTCTCMTTILAYRM